MIFKHLKKKFKPKPHYTMEKAMAPHSSTLAWKIPWMEEPGRLQSMGSLRVGHNWATSLSFFTFMHWRRKWQPTPAFLPRESQGPAGPGGMPSMGSHRVGHNWSDLAAAYLDEILAGYSHLNCRFFSFITLSMYCHSLLVWRVSI